MKGLEGLLREGLRGLGRSGWGGVASVGTIAAAFLIMGIFLLLSQNLGLVLTQWKEQVQVTVFLEEGLPMDQIAYLKKKISAEMAVKSLSYTSKEEALASFKRELKGQESLLEGLGENPLPASFQLKVQERYQSPEAIKRLVISLKRLEGVEDVLYGQEWVERLNTTVRLLRLMGLSVGLILTAASVLIVANTIRFSVHARAEEVEIMRLVGATKTYIRAPFLIEGLLQGLIGAILSLFLLFLIYKGVLWHLRFSPAQIYGLGVGRFLDPPSLVLTLGAGAAVGGLGSLISVSRLLRI